MGFTTHCRSPVAHREEESQASSVDVDEAMVSAHLDGQSDIRSFCWPGLTRKRSAGALMTPRDVQGDADESELLKLPGQMDIRKFLKRSPSADDAMAMDCYEESDHEEPMEMNASYDVACRHAWDADEEAAIAMGLHVGMLSYDMEEFLEVDDYNWTDLHEKEIAEDYTLYGHQEESARGMGLSLDVDDEVSSEPDWQTIEDLETTEFKPERHSFKIDEDACVKLGLSFGIEGPDEVAWYPAEPEEDTTGVWGPPPLRSYSAEEEAAKAMGLPLGVDGTFEEEQLDDLEDEALLAEALFLQAADASLFETQEDSALAMGLSLSLGDEFEKEFEHVVKKPRLSMEPNPATPPKRELAAKTTEEVTPDLILQAQKRRRLAEESKQDVGKKLGQLSAPEADTQVRVV